MYSIKKRALLLGSGAGIIIFMLMFISAYQIAYHETEDILNQKLKFIATWLANGQDHLKHLDSDFDEDEKYREEDIFIDRRLKKDLVSNREDNPIIMLEQSQEGFYRYQYDDIDFIAYVIPKNQTQIQVAQPISVRQHLALELAITMLAPFLLLLPIFLWFIYFGITRALSPIQRLQQEFASRQYHDLSKIKTEHYPIELTKIIIEANALFNRIEQAQQEQHEFINHAAHELRSPLTALILQTTLLEKEYPNSKTVGYLSVGIHRLQHLVQQLLDLAKQTDEENNIKQPIGIQQILKEVVEHLYILIENKKITLTFDAPEQDIILNINQHGLYLVFKNILDNAIKYTPNNGYIDIDVDVDVEQEQLNIIISDSGIGVEEEEYHNIMQKFYRIHNVGIGSGLGLAIVDKALQHLNGQIYFSKGSRGGLSAYIILPYSPNERFSKYTPNST